MGVATNSQDQGFLDNLSAAANKWWVALKE